MQEVLQLREQLAESRRSVEHDALRLQESQARADTLSQELAAARAGLVAAQAAAAAAEAVPAAVQIAFDSADLEERVAAGVAAAAQGESPDFRLWKRGHVSPARGGSLFKLGNQ